MPAMPLVMLIRTRGYCRASPVCRLIVDIYVMFVTEYSRWRAPLDAAAAAIRVML